MNIIEEPGAYPALPMADYIADPCPEPSMSKGVVNTIIDKSPAHAFYEHPRLGGNRGGTSKAAEHGTITHKLVLGGDEVLEVIEAENYRKKATQEQRDAARAAGKFPVLAHELGDLKAAAVAARAALAEMGCPDVIENSEQTLLWQEAGVWNRARPDYMTPDKKIIVDLKTCDDANPGEWSRKSLFNGGYHTQAAHYLAGAKALFGDDPAREFVFLVQEKSGPYCCSVVSINQEGLEFAQAKREAAAKLWRKCLDTNEWPGYPKQVYYVDVPVYLERQFQERMINAGVA